MAKNLALLGLVIIIGFVAYKAVSNLTGEVRFEGLRWDPFRITAPPSYSPPPSKRPVISESLPKSEPEKPKVVPPLGFEISDLSQNYRRVRLSSVRAARNPGERAQFTLKAEHNLSEGVSVSGWRIRANSGSEFFIPRAIADYNLLFLPPEGDIILYPQDYLNAYSWANSSFGGKNLRLNKCAGFLNASYNFDPKLPENCPAPNQSEIITFTGRCQTFIRSLKSCQMPSANQLNSFSGPNELACRAYLDKLNYRYCYDANRAKPDFFSDEWRAWLNQFFPFDREHDRLLLFDRAGKLVDEYIY